jgi:DNA-binding transcriptional ArsR family regulator
MPQPSLPRVFHALADPTRLAIVERLLAEGERTTGDIAAPFAISKPAISKHLKVLAEAGLIDRRIDRQWRVVRIRPDAVRALDEWFTRYRSFWQASFDRLDRLFASGKRREPDQGA